MTFLNLIKLSGNISIMCCKINTHYCAGDKIDRNEKTGNVARIGREEACTGFRWGKLRERDHWEDPDVDGRIVFRWIFNKQDVEVLDWIELAKDRDRWRALVNAVINLRVP
jgi:hypothetical protein